MDWLRVIFYGTKIVNSHLPVPCNSDAEGSLPAKDTFQDKASSIAILFIVSCLGVAGFTVMAIMAYWFMYSVIGLSFGVCCTIIGIPAALCILWFLFLFFR